LKHFEQKTNTGRPVFYCLLEQKIILKRLSAQTYCFSINTAFISYIF